MKNLLTRAILLGAIMIPSLSQASNPVLPGFHADPEILYSNKTGKYHIYSTTDGTPGGGGHYFHVFSSDNLKDWTDDGIMLDLKGDQVKWASGNAWAPAIIERKEGNGYKYYFYFSGHNPEFNRKTIGVAVSDDPSGPFTDLGHPIVTDSPVGRGKQIDEDVFQDPVSGKYFLYWGNGYMAGAELNDDLTSIKQETITVMTPKGGTLQDYAYREAPYVFFRNGTYYFMWSVDDTGSPNYHVAYGTSDNPLGPIKVADQPIVLIQNPEKEIYGTAHNSVIQLPGTDEWLIVYHRINKDYIEKEKGPGVHREVCIDRLEFNPDGTIKPVVPTL
ncbi:MAG: family 43 glycosylhydrolase [Muribaculaceae bacterium]|nr:family 43 glycosylhydrolase [Muribaculaceae bacterium]